LKKIFVLFHLFFLNKIYSQWEYLSNKSENKIEAVGKVVFNEKFKDSIIFKLSKSRDLELSFSIEGDFFQEDETYYVILDISERKFKASKAKVETGKYIICEIKDMVNSERFELEDFLKIFKMGESLVLTVRNNLKVIQGVNQLIGSTTAINRVITNKVL
tara:strand:- start:2641 stop:3120 length:480 start_codon:yes stop_codon:yes gene_type:complete